MSLWRHLSRRLRVLTVRMAADRDLDDEVRYYVEQATGACLARGLSPGEARRRARLELGTPPRSGPARRAAVASPLVALRVE
jgi:hypothetical protein